MNGRPFAASATPVEVNPSASPFIFPRYSAGSLPAAPSLLAATTISTSEIDLTWTDNSSNEVTFRIERANVTDSVFSEIGSVLAGVTSYHDTTASNMNGYKYRVRARNSAGNSAYSNTASAMTWGLASEGDLTVDGVDYVVTSGSKHDRGQINVINGGRILPDTTLDGKVWTMFAATGLYIDSTSQVDFSSLVTSAAGYTVSTVAPDGTILSYSPAQRSGAQGGASFSGASGGSQFNGNGGGGASAISPGGDANDSLSGAGADGNLNPAPGGSSVPINGQDGNPGTTDDETATDNSAEGASGSGGSRGRHGGTPYWRVNGAIVIDAGGVFKANGENGGSGGPGGDAITTTIGAPSANGGQGGGPAAGGTAGKIVIRYHSGSDPTPSLEVTEGLAGNIGLGGTASGTIPGFGQNGNPSDPAEDGDNGILDVATF